MKHSHPFLKWTAVNALKTAAILGTITAAGAILLQRFQMIGSATELYILGVLLVSLNTSGYLWGIIAAGCKRSMRQFLFYIPAV